MMDCSPDISYKGQLSLVRVVSCELPVGASVSEHFTGCVDVEDKAGRGLTETPPGDLQQNGLNISDCPGQSHNSSRIMKGQKQGTGKTIVNKQQSPLCPLQQPCFEYKYIKYLF